MLDVSIGVTQEITNGTDTNTSLAATRSSVAQVDATIAVRCKFRTCLTRSLMDSKTCFTGTFDAIFRTVLISPT